MRRKPQTNSLSREKGAVQEKHRWDERGEQRGERLCEVCIVQGFRVWAEGKRIGLHRLMSEL